MIKSKQQYYGEYNEKWVLHFCSEFDPELPKLLKVSPAVYLHLDDFTFKVHPLNWESRNQSKNILWVSRVPQSIFEANQCRGSWVMIGQSDRQTEITTLYMYRRGCARNSLFYFYFQGARLSPSLYRLDFKIWWIQFFLFLLGE